MNEFWTNWQPRILSVLRIIVGFLLVWHGAQKLFGFPPPGQPGELNGLMLVAGILEFFGGLLVLIGLFTRWTAFILSGLMAVAYFMVHASGKFFALYHQNSGSFAQKIFDSFPEFLPLVNRGELAVIYCFVFLYLFFAGGGVWSLDYLLKKKS